MACKRIGLLYKIMYEALCFSDMFSPVKSFAQTDSTSELLRFL